MKRKALGKGLKAYIPEDYCILKEERYADLDIEQLTPNPLQPRLKFDQESIDELARSIKKSGVIQPIIVVSEGNYYRIIIGEPLMDLMLQVRIQEVVIKFKEMLMYVHSGIPILMEHQLYVIPGVIYMKIVFCAKNVKITNVLINQVLKI